MKKIQFYTEKAANYFIRWKDYLPITNIALFCIVVVLAVIMASLVFLPVSGINPEEYESEKLKEFEKSGLISQKLDLPSSNEFDFIQTHNPFSPSRTDWEIAVDRPPDPPPTPDVAVKIEKPRPTITTDRIKLYAILMFGDTRVALIENLNISSNSPDKYVYVKQGDDIGGYTVKKIESNSLIVEWNEEETVIRLYSGL